MTENNISLQTENQQFIQQNQMTAQIQKAITHTHREALKIRIGVLYNG